MSDGKILLVDGDIVAYRAAAIAEPSRYLVQTGDHCETFDTHESARNYQTLGNKIAAPLSGLPHVIWSRKEDKGVEFTKEACVSTLEAMKEKLKPSDIRIFLSGRGNFRKEIDLEYKANREYLPKPKYLKAVKDYLINEWKAEVCDYMEADDGIGIAATGLGEKSLIATIDKDLDQIAGWHYNWVKDSLYNVSKREADFALYTQILAGDRVDNVRGIDGIGPHKARKILEGAANSDELFRRCWDVYRTRSGKTTFDECRQYLFNQARLCYIFREHISDPFSPDIPGFRGFYELKDEQTLEANGEKNNQEQVSV